MIKIPNPGLAMEPWGLGILRIKTYQKIESGMGK